MTIITNHNTTGIIAQHTDHTSHNGGISMTRRRILHKIFILVLIATVCMAGTGVTSAEPVEEWSKTFGGVDGESGQSVQQTSDGGYIITGETYSYGTGSSDLWLVKTDTVGTQMWSKTFGGADYDYGSSVQQTSDGGYIITGETYSYGTGSFDLWLVKTDAVGTQMWSKTFGGVADDSGQSVQQTSDGGYIITGYTYSYSVGEDDLWLVKTDASGTQVWSKTFGGAGYDWGDSVQQTSDGGYIITGGTESYGAGLDDLWLVKTDAAGTQMWSKTFGGAGYDWGDSVQQTSDGGYIITGSTESYGAGFADLWLIKTGAAGTQMWSKTFGGASYDSGSSVQQTSDGGYIITGQTESYGAGLDDLWLVKTDAAGTQMWSKTFGGADYDYGNSVQQTSDGGYIITGLTTSYGTGLDDLWLVKVSSETDNTSPTITITSPTDDITVTTPSFTISGTASDDIAIASVIVNGIIASGTTSWSKGITLTEGTNTITVVATDTSGNTATDSIIVTYALADNILTSLYTTSSPAIDGVFNVGEWSNRKGINLNGYDNPFSTKSGDLYIMNNANTLYVAVVIPDTVQDVDYLMLDFDNGNDHIASFGREDAVGFNVANLYGGSTGYLDYYWDGSWWTEDSIRHGTGAMGYKNGVYTYEFSKPLDSGDVKDMALVPGDSVGFRIETRDGTLNDWYRYPENTVNGITSRWNEWDDLIIAESSGTTPPSLTGDVNGDGILSSVDALMALHMSAGNIAEDLAADVSGDGSVTSLDALMILQASVGAIVL